MFNRIKKKIDEIITEGTDLAHRDSAAARSYFHKTQINAINSLARAQKEVNELRRAALDEAHKAINAVHDEMTELDEEIDKLFSRL